MEDKQKEDNAQPAKQLSIQEQNKLLEEVGIETVEKTGAILMPLSKQQRESMEKALKRKKESE